MSKPLPRLASAPLSYSAQHHSELIARSASALAAPYELADGPRLRCDAACLGYHRGWVLLQHLGLISGLASERQYMIEAIRAVAAKRTIGSVLIAGCADFGLLSIVHEALGETVSATRIATVDHCETPLALCRLYAGEMGFDVACHRHELLSGPPAGVYDLVLMHSLLSFCRPAERRCLMASLAASLAFQGTLLAYQSIRPAAEPVTLAYGSDEIEALVRRGRTDCDTAIATARLTHDAVEEHIRSFCHAKTTISVPSVAGVVQDAEALGLTLSQSRLLFDSRSSHHRAATPDSYFMKYEFRLQKSGCSPVVRT